MPHASPDDVNSDLLVTWYKRFGGTLTAFFRRRGVPATECDDLTQEVFLRLARQPDLGEVRFEERYLHRVAANVLADRHRYRLSRAAGSHQAIEDVGEISDEAASQERVAVARDTLSHLQAALACMPERTRTIFALHHFDGMPYKGIAARCGVAVRTVEDHMARANLFLLAALEQAL